MGGFAGVVWVTRAQNGEAFSPEESGLFQLLVEDLNAALQNTHLYDLAIRDPLTGLFTRRHFQQRLAQELERCRRFQLPLSLMILDINHFKAINDELGHTAGDQVLREVAEVLASGTRAADIPVRFGGDEFAVLLVQADQTQAALAAKRIVSEVSQRVSFPRLASGRAVTLSVGVATFPGDGDSMKALIEAADRAMYEHKRGTAEGSTCA